MAAIISVHCQIICFPVKSNIWADGGIVKKLFLILLFVNPVFGCSIADFFAHVRVQLDNGDVATVVGFNDREHAVLASVNWVIPQILYREYVVETSVENGERIFYSKPLQSVLTLSTPAILGGIVAGAYAAYQCGRNLSLLTNSFSSGKK